MVLDVCKAFGYIDNCIKYEILEEKNPVTRVADCSELP